TSRATGPARGYCARTEHSGSDSQIVDGLSIPPDAIHRADADHADDGQVLACIVGDPCCDVHATGINSSTCTQNSYPSRFPNILEVRTRKSRWPKFCFAPEKMAPRNTIVISA